MTRRSRSRNYVNTSHSALSGIRETPEQPVKHTEVSAEYRAFSIAHHGQQIHQLSTGEMHNAFPSSPGAFVSGTSFPSQQREDVNNAVPFPRRQSKATERRREDPACKLFENRQPEQLLSPPISSLAMTKSNGLLSASPTCLWSREDSLCKWNSRWSCQLLGVQLHLVVDCAVVTVRFGRLLYGGVRSL